MFLEEKLVIFDHLGSGEKRRREEKERHTKLIGVAVLGHCLFIKHVNIAVVSFCMNFFLKC